MDKEKINKIAKHPLQTWEWGEFRKKTGNEVVRFNFGQLTLHNIPFTKYKVAAFIKGPVPTTKMISDLKKLADKKKVVFVKLEPNIVTNNEKIINLLKKEGAVPGKTLFTPTSFWLDLTKGEDEMLKSFHSKTRYNIRLAERRGVKVKENNSKGAFEKYIKLTRKTVERQGFYAHTEKYHRLMWDTLHTQMVESGEEPIARLLTATHQGKTITTWILFVWKDFLYYPYGASSHESRRVMANNLVMWEAIKYGKSLGLKTFDLWGREPGKGFTKFKEGYNPQVVKFTGTWDLVTSPLYSLYKLTEAVRWVLLRARTKIGFTKPNF